MSTQQCVDATNTPHLVTRVRVILNADHAGACMLNSAFHRLGFLGLISLVVLGAAPCLATQPAAELSAIEAMLARGDDQSALPRVNALLTALPDDASPRQPAHLELLLARALDAGEKDHDGVIAAATRAIEGFGSDPEFADQVLEARRLRGLAWTRQRNADKALAELGEVERLMRERGADQSPAHAQVLSDLSLAQRISADYGGALTSLDAALAILRQQAAPDSRALARTLIRMGQTRRISGDLERADAAYREALALELTSPDPSGRNQATVLYALGNLARARAQPVQAIDWYAKALPAFKRVYGADSLQSAMLYNNYGNAESEIPGHGDAAIARFQQALEIAQRKQSKNVADFLPLGNIAMVRVWQGRFVEAETGFRGMLAKLRDAPAGAESSPLFSQHGLAAALWGQGRHVEAFNAATAAETTRQTAVREVASGLSDEQALAYQEQDYTTLDHALAIALDSKDPRLLERAWSLAISARGQVTAIQAERLARARVDKDAKLQPLWKELQAASAGVERLRSAGLANSRASTRLERAERQLAQALPPAGRMANSTIDLGTLRAARPADTALVWLHDLRHTRPTDFANAAVDIEDAETWAFVLPPGDVPVVAIRLGSAQGIAAALAAWQASLATPTSEIAEVRDRGASLAKTVWLPIRKATAAKRFLIIAEGPLLRLPWPALPDADGYLVERDVQFHVLNHERDLFATTARPAPQHALLAVADPRGGEKGDKASRTCPDGSALPALPGARREVERIAQLLRKQGDDRALLALVGDDASEARFRREAPQAALLHLATHGIEAGSSGCAGNSVTRGISLRAQTSGEASAASTALLLAAPKQGDGSNTDDGLLGAMEIAALDLGAVQWAVLAACSTASGSTRAYEGLNGLARAFHLAGARTVLLSLWSVDDEATAQWSEALYLARIADKADTPTAMQHAQRAVLKSRRAAGRSDHPYFWAGFVALGDWR